MGRLEGRVAIVTGAGQGLGRAHALYLASQGASVVVNDLGASLHGEGSDATPAQRVVAEIREAGGKAVRSDHNVADWNQAGELVRKALEAFGSLHVLVNNAGIVRDRTLANMSEQEWDAVISVHLKGHAATSHHALAYWRSEAKAGRPVKASVIHTTSIAGFAGNFGQANYAAAKLGVVALSRTIALEGAIYGVRSNAISPSARSRMTLESGDSSVAPPEDPNAFDMFDPANVSPLIGWLAEEGCPANEQVLYIYGNRLQVISMPQTIHDLHTVGRWTPEAIESALAEKLLSHPQAMDFLS